MEPTAEQRRDYVHLVLFARVLRTAGKQRGVNTPDAQTAGCVRLRRTGPAPGVGSAVLDRLIARPRP